MISQVRSLVNNFVFLKKKEEMESLVGGMKAMVKVFRRECHKVFHSERTTIHGADGMLMVLQLAMADVNKKVIN